MGRRAHQPDVQGRRQVEAMAAYGIPEIDIGRVLGIDPKTLRKHYREELDTGSIKANSKMAENLYRKALGDGPQAVSATIFWLKTRAGWRETVVNQVNVDASDSLRLLMQRIGEQGRRIFDRVIDVTPDGVNDASAAREAAPPIATASVPSIPLRTTASG